MSIEEKVGQTMIWTFAGTSFSPQVRDMVSRYRLGALIVFSRNIKSHAQIAKFNFDAQNFAARKLKAPIFLMIDQEGGMVTRVKIGTPVPSALAVGHLRDAPFTERYAQASAEMLSSLGFNMNLAPVMDMTNPELNSFISNRVFGSGPSEVTELALAYAKGLSLGGMIPTAKHFPGHGGLSTDSHLTTARKSGTLEELEARDLAPFMKFAKETYPRAIMMAHISVPNVDPTGLPATYSPKMIQDLLRGKYGYQGLVITDDLEMGGASISEDVGERAVRAFLAGNDMMMLAGSPRHQRRAFEALVAAVKEGRIPTERLNNSVVRILEAKSSLQREGLKNLSEKSTSLRTKLEALSREIMRKNFKDSLKSKTSKWPIVDPSTRVGVMTSDRRFHAAFARQFHGHADLVALTPETLASADREIARRDRAFSIYYASGGVTAKWLNNLSPDLRAKTIVVNCNDPGKISDGDGFLGVLNINSASPEAGGWLADEIQTPGDIRTPATTTEQDEDDASPGQNVEESLPFESGSHVSPERSSRRPSRSTSVRAEGRSRQISSREPHASRNRSLAPFAP